MPNDEHVSLLGRGAAACARLSGRNLPLLERMDPIDMVRGPADQRGAVVTLADCGRQVLDEAAPLRDKCQRRTELRVGHDRASALRDILGLV